MYQKTGVHSLAHTEYAGSDNSSGCDNNSYYLKGDYNMKGTVWKALAYTN